MKRFLSGNRTDFETASNHKPPAPDIDLSEQQYQRIFEASKDMILIVSRNGGILQANPASVELLGFDSKQELLALSTVERIYANPQHWQVFRTQIHRNGFAKDYEARFKKKDGTFLHCLLSGSASRNAKGEIVGYESFAKDITARMDAIRKLRQRNWELQVLNSVAFAMNKTQDIEDILLTVLDKALEVLSLSTGGIFLIDYKTASFELKVNRGFCMDSDCAGFQVELYDKSLMNGLRKKDFKLNPSPTFPPFKAAFTGSGRNRPCELTCFLITAKDRASGFFAFNVHSHKHPITGQQFDLLGSLGNFLGSALENALLQQTIHQHREELKELTTRLFQSNEDERKRIARELHDEAGPVLTGVNLTLETIVKKLAPDNRQITALVRHAKKQVRQTYREMRRISYRLHPALLSDLGLEPALETFLSEVSQRSGLAVDFKMIGFETRIKPEIEIVLYRLSQEALTNTLKHAHAGHFKLTIIKGYPNIIFVAEDDGIGFDTTRFERMKPSLGLLSMRERAAMLIGRFDLRSAPGQGTRIRIEFPIKDDTDDE